MPIYDKGDYCLRASLYSTAAELIEKNNPISRVVMYAMKKECRLTKWLGHRKSLEYRWSDSDGITKWLYDNILSCLHINPYKGLNGDQYRAYFTWLFIKKDYINTLKVVFGFIIRLGFYPSFTEHAIFRPQVFVLLTRLHWSLYPLYLIIWPFWRISKYYNLKEPIEKSTTNKITLLLTMKLLGYELPNKEYIIKVYTTYFNEQHNNAEIGEKLIQALVWIP